MTVDSSNYSLLSTGKGRKCNVEKLGQYIVLGET
jgi:hypothetical protein